MLPGRKVRLRHVETKEELDEATAHDLKIDVEVEVDPHEDEPTTTDVRLNHLASEEEEEKTVKAKSRSEVLGDAVDRLLALSEEPENEKT